MAHDNAEGHIVQVTGTVFEVDPIARKVTSGEVKKLITGDHNCTRWGFTMPRFINGHDMSLCQEVSINTTNIHKDKKMTVDDIYYVDDFSIDENDDQKMSWTWLVKRGATMREGTTEFGLCFRCLTDGAIDYDLNIEKCTDEIVIRKGKHNEEGIDENYYSFLAQWMEEFLEEAPDIGSGLPEATTEGAFLRVVDGEWKESALENAEGVSF